MTAHNEDQPLDEREQARIKRRDRDASAQGRALMRTGLAKNFKQILDVQAKKGREAKEARARRAQREARGQGSASTE